MGAFGALLRGCSISILTFVVLSRLSLTLPSFAVVDGFFLLDFSAALLEALADGDELRIVAGAVDDLAGEVVESCNDPRYFSMLNVICSCVSTEIEPRTPNTVNRSRCMCQPTITQV